MLDLSDTRVPVGTTGLIQRQNLSVIRVPVGTAEQIRYRTELIQIRALSDTGVPIGTTGLIQR